MNSGNPLEFLNWFKPGLPIYAAFATSGFVVLLLPQTVIASYGAGWIVLEYKWLIFLWTLIFSLITIFTGMTKFLSSKLYKDALENFSTTLSAKSVKSKFDNLEDIEKVLIAMVIESYNRSFRFPPKHPTIQSLVDKGWAQHAGPGYADYYFRIDRKRWDALNRSRAAVRIESQDLSEATNELARALDAMEREYRF